MYTHTIQNVCNFSGHYDTHNNTCIYNYTYKVVGDVAYQFDLLCKNNDYRLLHKYMYTVNIASINDSRSSLGLRPEGVSNGSSIIIISCLR